MEKQWYYHQVKIGEPPKAIQESLEFLNRNCLEPAKTIICQSTFGGGISPVKMAIGIYYLSEKQLN